MYDLAPMLTPSQVDSINAAAVSFSAQHHCNIWLVTESLGSAAQVTSARAQADEQEILREWGTGCDIAVVFLADDARTTWWWREGSSGLPALPADFATQLNGVPKDDFGKWYVADGFIAIINKFGQALP
jgi:hypothetical protein